MPKSVLRAVLGRMQVTLHATRRIPHGASRMVQARSAWLVKTRRAPSRHGRDARFHGRMTTAMHKLRTPPPPPLHAVPVKNKRRRRLNSSAENDRGRSPVVGVRYAAMTHERLLPDRTETFMCRRIARKHGLTSAFFL